MPALEHLAAPAKLNLFLHVTGRRPDGYHLLQSVFVLLDWCDTLHIETRTDGRLQRHDLSTPLPADDLCLRAARLLQHESACPLGADIHIDKQVPAGAGMGGGSSDAATVLLALNRLWALNWPVQRLAALAVRLGADVPFFVHGHNAWVEGIGEHITPLVLPQDLLDTPVAVLKPPVTVPTQTIFSSPDLCRTTEAAIVLTFLAEPKRFGRNDLEAPARAYSHQIGQALEVMQNRFGNSRMTGSGSAVFSWTSNAGSFGPADVGLDESSWVGRLCRVLVRHPLLDTLA